MKKRTSADVLRAQMIVQILSNTPETSPSFQRRANVLAKIMVRLFNSNGAR